MKALVHCALLALLFVLAATASTDGDDIVQSDDLRVAAADASNIATTPIPTTVSTDTSNITPSPVTSSSATSTEDESITTINMTAITNYTSSSSNDSSTAVPSVTTQSNTSSSSNDSSTAVPSVTTQSNNGSSTITITKSDSPRTDSPVTFSSVSSPNTGNTNPDNTTDGCQEDSCSGASCVSLNNEFFCLCIDGYYYNSSKCNKGKIFPGVITVKVSETSGLEDEHSVAYEKLYLEVTNFFQDAFVNTDYGQTVINKVRISSSARSEFRANQGEAAITVVNLFSETTKENKTSVANAINKASEGNSDIAEYVSQDLCDFYGCVKTSEEDDCDSGLLCTCKEGLERPNPQIALCVAGCSDDCNAENHKQCLMENDEIAKCTCLPGYEQKDGGICQACAFGYGGVNCEDKFQLILIIVGIVAGVLILGMMIALILVRSKKKANNIEEQNLIKNDFQNLRLQETTDFSNVGAEGSIFPKIRTNFSRENQLQNPYVNQRSIPRPDY